MHRRPGLEVMYSKGCLATGYDAGKAIIHKGEYNGGAPLCVLHILVVGELIATCCELIVRTMCRRDGPKIDR